MIDEGSGRVLRRILGLSYSGPAYSDRHLYDIAKGILPDSNVRDFNLALIDIGAAHCHPRKPNCSDCPLLAYCCFAIGLETATVATGKVSHATSRSPGSTCRATDC